MVKGGLMLIALLNGGWMIFDGIHVLLKGKYFGPEEPGPWSHLVRALHLDPFSLGIPFVLLGLAWLLAFGLLLGSVPYAWQLAVVVAILGVWYLPVGTLFSITALIVLFVYRDTLGAG